MAPFIRLFPRAFLSKHPLTKWGRLTALCIFAATSTSVAALDYNLEFEAFGGYSDNSNRQRDGQEQEDSNAGVGAGFGVSHESKTLTINLDYDARYRDYKNQTIDTRSNITGTTNANWNIVDERFAWDFNHQIREALANQRVVDTPDTRETRQILTTGPKFTARLSQADNLILTLAYTILKQGDAEFETPDERQNLDSKRQQAGLTWEHSLTRTSNFNLGYTQSTTKPDDNSSDITYNQLFAGYNVQLASGSYSIQLGANQIERDQSSDTQGFYGAINFNREFSGQAITIDVVRQLTDSSIGLNARGSSSFGLNAQSSNTSSASFSNFDQIAIVERTNVSVTYSHDHLCRGCSWLATYSYDQEDFDQNDQSSIINVGNNKGQRIRSLLRYQVNSKLSTGVDASFRRAKFDTDNRTDDTLTINLDASLALTDSFTFRFSVNHRSRDTDYDQTEILDFDEMSARITAVYTVR